MLFSCRDSFHEFNAVLSALYAPRYDIEPTGKGRYVAGLRGTERAYLSARAVIDMDGEGEFRRIVGTEVQAAARSIVGQSVITFTIYH